MGAMGPQEGVDDAMGPHDKVEEEDEEEEGGSESTEQERTETREYLLDRGFINEPKQLEELIQRGFTVSDCRSIFNADGSLCVSGVVMQAIREGVNPKPHLQHDDKSYMAFSGDRSSTRMAEELYDFLYPMFTENSAGDAI